MAETLTTADLELRDVEVPAMVYRLSLPFAVTATMEGRCRFFLSARIPKCVKAVVTDDTFKIRCELYGGDELVVKGSLDDESAEKQLVRIFEVEIYTLGRASRPSLEVALAEEDVKKLLAFLDRAFRWSEKVAGNKEVQND
jgi:hypothetical protein